MNKLISSLIHSLVHRIYVKNVINVLIVSRKSLSNDTKGHELMREALSILL